MVSRIAALMVLSACAEPALDHQASAVVFGADDRREPHESSEPHAEIARRRVATRIVDWAVDFTEPAAPRITYTRTLGESLDLCEGEPFIDQIAPGSCSATLIDDRHLLTAGHCVSSADECTASHYWVFGFHMDASGSLATLSADDVYQCSRVVVSDVRDDYSIIELDREVRGRDPVDVRLHEAGLPLGMPVTLVGFPDGIPVKVDAGGVVVYSAPGRYFRATVDAFDSSSGSGVFDDEGRLIGVLQRGFPDYVARGECNVVNVLDESDEGEIVGYPDAAMTAYCAVNPESRQCGCEGPCWVAAPVDAGLDDGGIVDAGAVDAMVDALSDAPGLDAGMGAGAGCDVGGGGFGWLWVLLLVGTTPRARARAWARARE